MMAIDLVCWDFGDTLVDERFMRIAPDGVSEWERVYDRVLAERPEWVEAWNLGRGSINDLVEPLAERLPMTSRQVARHLRVVWRRIVWFPDSERWVKHLAGRVDQAVVTVNPHEFSGIATACGLDLFIGVIVTSAELGTGSKVVMAERARELLDLPGGLSSTLLIDNRDDNTTEFLAAGGHAIHYRNDGRSLDGLAELLAENSVGEPPP